MKDRGRRTAAIGFGLVIAVLAALGVAARNIIVEEWYLRDLATCQNYDEDRSRIAAHWLGEHGSERALARLFEVTRVLAIRPDAEEHGSGAQNSLIRIGEAMEGIVDRERGRVVPFLVTLLEEEPPHPIPGNQVRFGAATLLGRIGPEAREAVPALRSALNSEDPRFWSFAQQALEKIEGKAPTPAPGR